MTVSVTEALRRRLEELATITGDGPGVTRPAFGALERAAHERIGVWATADGARVETDPAGNTVVIYREGEPYLLLGSHLDSVPQGGRFDGTVGVVAALHVARTVAPQVELGVRVVAFSAEEGARFGRPCLGSELATGAMPGGLLDALRDTEGRSAAEVAASSGLRPAECPAWACVPAVAVYLELHIEQGRVLEREGVRLGIVDVVAGAVRLAVRLTGRPEHSGTTPMDDRLDALAAAAEMVLAVEEIARSGRHGVATVGRLRVEPNSATTVPGAVDAVVDVRDVDAGRQRQAVARIRAAIAALAERRGVVAEIRELAARDPVMLSAWPRRALADACAERELPFRVLPSGAGHDAAVVALTAPSALLFVPTPGGRSHVPDEQCRIDDVAVACEVMAGALRRLDLAARGAATAVEA